MKHTKKINKNSKNKTKKQFLFNPTNPKNHLMYILIKTQKIQYT
jgi:hypothetical protein